MCVTRFDQSEWAICNQKEWFSRLERVVFRVVYGEIFNLFEAWIGKFRHWYRRGKLLEHFILIVVTLLLNIFAFLRVWDKFELLGHMWKPPRWFECYFRRSSWIYYWLLLAVLSDYFGHLVSSPFLLCKFWGLPGSTPGSFPVVRRWKSLGLKRSSQPGADYLEPPCVLCPWVNPFP